MQPDTSMDFLNCLELDASVKIFSALEDPLDLAATSAVSRSWRNFVISNRLVRSACLKKFPQLTRIYHVCEPCCVCQNLETFGPEDSIECENFDKEHRVYAYLARAATEFPVKGCILAAAFASSTDHFPRESIYNTIEPRDVVDGEPSYWSSTGQPDPTVPETLVYKLIHDVCIITEINVHPLKAYFERGSPVYSARFVRFRMGYPKTETETGGSPGESGRFSMDDKFVWAYTSPQFPMAQENRMQNKFTLPQPVLCIGGYLQIELLGRVLRHEIDDLFYICVSHVKVMGRSLDEVFGVDVLEPPDKFTLKVLSYMPPAAVTENTHTSIQRENVGQFMDALHWNLEEFLPLEWDGEDDDGEFDEYIL